MVDQKIKYWVGISGFNGLGRKRFQLLREYFGSVEGIWKAGKKQLQAVGIKPKMVEVWDQWRRFRNLDQDLEEMNKRLIKGVTIEDKDYPKLLKEIDLAPFIIFVRGSVKVLNRPCLAMVGSRLMTGYGRQIITKLIPGLTNQKLVIVSGLARGVDSAVHRCCLDNGGLTVAVLGHGLDRIYPSENQRLAEAMVAKGGSLVTEYPLGFPIYKGNFPARNRIVAGLSLGVVVIEGAHQSGTKITATWAAEYGREVWAVPGPITSRQSEAPADLIKEGAKVVTSAEDILEELRLS